MNNFSLSIMIAHYCADRSNQSYDSFIKTLDTIQSQSKKYNIEIIIADDGSNYSKNIINEHSEKVDIPNDTRNLFILKNQKLKEHLNNLNINNNLITKWLYIPKTKLCMSKARLWNYGTQYSKSNKLLFPRSPNSLFQLFSASRSKPDPSTKSSPKFNIFNAPLDGGGKPR